MSVGSTDITLWALGEDGWSAGICCTKEGRIGVSQDVGEGAFCCWCSGTAKLYYAVSKKCGRSFRCLIVVKKTVECYVSGFWFSEYGISYTHIMGFAHMVLSILILTDHKTLILLGTTKQLGAFFLWESMHSSLVNHSFLKNRYSTEYFYG